MHQNKHQYPRIGLASPEQTRARADKVLPTGEIVGRVTQPSTFHHGSDDPEKDGTSRERISGPLRSGVRARGKYQQVVADGGDSIFCQECGAEYIESRVRRYRMGYIKSACAVTHARYLKNLPSHIANIPSKPLQELESLAYRDPLSARPVTEKPTPSGFKRGFLKYDEYGNRNETIPHFSHCSDSDESMEREATTGGDAIREPSASPDPKALSDRAHAEWEFWLSGGPTTGDELEDRRTTQRGKDLLVRHIGLIKNLVRTKTNPEWTVPSLSPVPPPEPRPMVQLGEGRMISPDINEPHRRIILRNNCLGNPSARRILAPEGVLVRQKKLLQGAVDAPIGNGIGGEPMTDTDERPSKPSSDMVQGKEGRSRENSPGKRVDHPGRPAIVVGPYLSLHQCGSPRGIAMEPPQPFIIRSSIGRHIAPSIRAAKPPTRKKTPLVREILREVVRGHPVSLNRAPTPHRPGIQAFEPISADGCAIRSHPSVCAGSNADSDGDQMAVHVPLPYGTQAEARPSALSHTNPPSPAMGDPVSAPNQDMPPGPHIPTIGNGQGIRGNRYYHSCRGHGYNPFVPYDTLFHGIHYFNGHDALPVTELQQVLDLLLQSPLWLRWPTDDSRIMNPIDREEPFEVQYEPTTGTCHQIHENYKTRWGGGNTLSVYVRTTAGRIIFNQRMESSLRGGIFGDYSLLKDVAISPRNCIMNLLVTALLPAFAA
uniref:DNA-directed RNA polymerase subunit n=1 Tax=Selaginella doederleinii TaxID=186426 RepID=A0A482CLN3_9TRAC|nr:RNA polymerase beta [Selaginella doederleinii]QBL76011.1 RNA polymerase beta [Selaginella doederleinii]